MKWSLRCGSGLSGELLTERGHMWLGIDISTAMLTVAAERDIEGDVILADMGDGLPFRPGTFDGCISISAVQWLCYANKAVCSPPHRLLHFFSSLYACLKRGARAVFQLYPQNADQLELISSQAMKAGFSGGMVVDFPNSTKAKKFFLCLFSGGTASLPKALVDEDAQEGVQYTNSRLRYSSLKGKSVKKSRNWILEKKERQRLQGKDVRHNSKYTGRRRKFCF
uniref:BUD23 rRNA methyltransferase and ribosome maturation factor n=1 Tax=Eptatretus burgeri TaxID=7764 RepID=A0A8C4Q738_EPTBU